MINELDNRYQVLKISDIEENLTLTEKKQLANIVAKIEAIRGLQKRGPLDCLVIESDWPEYDETKRALLARINKQ